MQYQGVEVTKQWDGYMTVTQAVAKAISCTGELPKLGKEVKTTLTKPDPVELGKTIPMWIGWTYYNKVPHLWLH